MNNAKTKTMDLSDLIFHFSKEDRCIYGSVKATVEGKTDTYTFTDYDEEVVAEPEEGYFGWRGDDVITEAISKSIPTMYKLIKSNPDKYIK
jgi:hypothetical protein